MILCLVCIVCSGPSVCKYAICSFGFHSGIYTDITSYSTRLNVQNGLCLCFFFSFFFSVRYLSPSTSSQMCLFMVVRMLGDFYLLLCSTDTEMFPTIGPFNVFYTE